ncbi:MAG: hypothetical protein EON59_03280 [Alphaproteobacteria bacterium]|nr:MAG: hypothetical protein EON59_03280 [Alphaproteobacteria bacterium]
MTVKKLSYSNLPQVARGCADSIVAHGGCNGYHDEWQDIGHGDFSAKALQVLADDCAKFIETAQGLHPDGKAGLRRAIKYHDLGWHFFLARQGTGVGFENFMLGDFGEQLTQLAEGYGRIEVEITDDQEISFHV